MNPTKQSRPAGPALATARPLAHGGLWLLAAMQLLIHISLSLVCSMSVSPASAAPLGDAKHGGVLIQHYGCGSCHTIPGADDAAGLVGPPLTKIADRIYIAGTLRNTPDNMIEWLRAPQRIVPGNAMPDMGISERDAEDIAAYLYTLR